MGICFFISLLGYHIILNLEKKIYLEFLKNTILRIKESQLVHRKRNDDLVQQTDKKYYEL